MNYQKYDILLVNFPYTDLTHVKKRPALVIAELEGQNIIVCQITTKKHSLITYEISLLRQHCEGNVRFDSCIYVDLIATLHKNQIFGKIGRIKDFTVKKAVDEKLHALFCK